MDYLTGESLGHYLLTPESHGKVFSLLDKEIHKNVVSIFPSSKKLFSWTCSDGHKWESPVGSILKSFEPCPYCGKRKPIVGFNDLLTSNPTLVTEWHPTKNDPLLPSDFLPGSNKKIWWKCLEGHEWQASISNRHIHGRGCGVCANNLVLKGFNDFPTTHPELLFFWDYSNNEILPTSLSFGSNKIVSWRNIECGHKWQQTVKAQTNSKTPCPVCSGSIIQSGVNDAETIYPYLKKYFNTALNNEPLSQIAVHSDKSVNWKCPENNHIWKNRIRDQVKRKYPCLVCSNKVASDHYNLITLKPHLADQWNTAKNATLKPEQVLPSSGRKVWWQCKKGHEWEATIASRKSSGCPICSNKKVSTGVNDLVTIDPNTALQWHPTKNGTLKPDQFTTGSDQMVWWECSKGHEWKTRLANRFSKGKIRTNCPTCSYSKFRSEAEQQIAEYLNAELNIKTVLGSRTIIPKSKIELDIYAPDYKIAIEFNGVYWHSEARGKTRLYHYEKWLACRHQGIQLIQIWEDDWNENKSLILRSLNHKFGLSHEEKIFARKTSITEINYAEAKSFLDKHHIQGAVKGTDYIALKEQTSDEIIAVSVIMKTAEGNIYLQRYATSKHVIGGFSKVLRHIENQNNYKQIITFSDNSLSDGNLYKVNGFREDLILKPDYKYLVKGKREHKFGYRLKRFKKDPSLLWQEGKTESQLAQLNNLPRIWDAGKIRWVKVATA